MEAKVSVLLPAYNAAATLAAALDSLLAQTIEDFEVVAVDDGSTDATADILAAYAQGDRRVRVLSRPHEGLVPALNAGLGACRGVYVARMDADDRSLPQRLARQAAHLDAHPEVGLVACRVRYGGDPAACGGYARYVDWTNTLRSHEDIALHRFRESPFAHPSVMFRRELAARLGGYRQGTFPEDYELWLRWLAAGVRMEKLEDELLVWNDPPQRLSRTHPAYTVEAFYVMKTGYLAAWLAAHNPRHPEVWVAGAGRTSRKRADLLAAHGVRVSHYLDVDPAKVGHVVHGRPVLDREALPEPGRAFVLCYLAGRRGPRGAGDDFAAFASSRGHVMGRDFLLCA